MRANKNSLGNYSCCYEGMLSKTIVVMWIVFIFLFINTAKSAEISLPPMKTVNLGHTIELVAKEFNIPPTLIASVIEVESNGNHCALSEAGAMGLMQLMPETAVYLEISDPFDPIESVYFGTKYLKELLIQYEGNLVRALAHYNGGTRMGNAAPGHLVAETQRYVEKVLELLADKEFHVLRTNHPVISLTDCDKSI